MEEKEQREVIKGIYERLGVQNKITYGGLMKTMPKVFDEFLETLIEVYSVLFISLYLFMYIFLRIPSSLSLLEVIDEDL